MLFLPTTVRSLALRIGVLACLCVVGLACGSSSKPKSPAKRGGGDACTPKKSKSKKTKAKSLALELFRKDDVTYESTIKPLLEANCTICHGEGGNDPKLLDWRDVKGARMKVISVIMGDEMPQEDPLGKADKEAFTEWRDGGYLEDEDSDPLTEDAAGDDGDDDDASGDDDDDDGSSSSDSCKKA